MVLLFLYFLRKQVKIHNIFTFANKPLNHMYSLNTAAQSSISWSMDFGDWRWKKWVSRNLRRYYVNHQVETLISAVVDKKKKKRPHLERWYQKDVTLWHSKNPRIHMNTSLSRWWTHHRHQLIHHHHQSRLALVNKFCRTFISTAKRLHTRNFLSSAVDVLFISSHWRPIWTRNLKRCECGNRCACVKTAVKKKFKRPTAPPSSPFKST